MKHVLWAALIAMFLATAPQAQDQPARFKDIRAQEHSDPHGAFDAMLVLAETGYARAMDRVGYYHRQGIGTAQNLDAAQDWYRRAALAGHPWSTATLARVEIDLGQGAAALKLLENAAKQDLPGTRRLLATAHIDRQFGTGSNPEDGRVMLENMIADGDARAARDLLVRHNWNRLQGRVPDAAVGLVVQTGLTGDPRYAEAALIYLTRRAKQTQTTIQTRAALAEVKGIRSRVLSVERIRLAADTHPHQFWTKTEDILHTTHPEDYARVASTAFWISKNAWVRVLQKELRGLGYYTGAIHGRMTTRTIRAQNRFCRDSGLWSTCATGPLRGATVRAVAGAIAQRKAGA